LLITTDIAYASANTCKQNRWNRDVTNSFSSAPMFSYGLRRWAASTVLVLQPSSNFTQGTYSTKGILGGDFGRQMRGDGKRPFSGVTVYSRVRRKGAGKRGCECGQKANSKHWFTTSFLEEGAGKRCSECGRKAHRRTPLLGVWAENRPGLQLSVIDL